MRDAVVAVYPALGDPYEPHVAALLKHVSRPGDTVFDVGANFGYHSLELMRHLGWRPADVHLFEPNPTVAACLRRSIAANGLADGMHLVEAAVGSTKGTVTLKLVEDSWGASSVSGALNATGRPYALRVTDEIPVPVISLDEYCAEQRIDQVGVMKVDVEGFEPAVIAGARSTIRRSSHLRMLLEFTPKAYDRPSAFFSELCELFPHRYTLHRRRGLRPIGTFDDLLEDVDVDLVDCVFSKQPILGFQWS